MSSVVYFFRLGKGGPVKIGFSGNLQRRVRAIAEGMPDHLVVEATVPGGRALERRLHLALHASRRRNEWFNPTPEVEAVVSMAKLKGLGPLLRWLACKETAVDARCFEFESTDDFEADIRALTAIAFRLAKARFGTARVAQQIGKSVDQVANYANGKALPGVVTLFNLAALDPGAVMPFFARCGEVPKWIAEEAARDAIEAQLAKLAPGSAVA
jgi:transcriptional regulator with XRE-family HTH domain